MSGIQIVHEEPSDVVAPCRLYLTADKSTVVLDGDPAAAFLLAHTGHNVPAEHAEAALVALDIADANSDSKQSEPPADKQVDKPADKSVKVAPNKGS